MRYSARNAFRSVQGALVINFIKELLKQLLLVVWRIKVHDLIVQVIKRVSGWDVSFHSE